MTKCAYEDLNETYIKAGKLQNTCKCKKCGRDMMQVESDGVMKWTCTGNWDGCFHSFVGEPK